LAATVTGVDVGFLSDELPAAILQSLEGLSQVAQIASALKAYSQSEGRMVATSLNQSPPA
jgi:hypothetical protein